MGKRSLLVQCGEILLGRDFEIAGIISSDRDVMSWAKARDIELIEPEADLANVLGKQPFDYFFSMGNTAVIPGEVLTLARKQSINFHDGPLPSYAGLNAPAWALINEETSYGITWHVMTDRVDGGDILKQRKFAVSPNETSVSLNTKCLEAAISAFNELADDLIKGTVTTLKQDPGERSYFSRNKRPRAACTISWDRPAEEIEALVRALNFGPYANPLGVPKVILGRDLLAVRQLELTGSGSPALPGVITHIGPHRFHVATATHDVAIAGLSSLDGQSLSMPDAAARYGLRVGDQLESLDSERATRLTTINAGVCGSEDFWVERLASLQPVEMPYVDRNGQAADGARYEALPLPLPEGMAGSLRDRANGIEPASLLLTALGIYLARIGGALAFDAGFRDASLTRYLDGVESWFADYVPLRFDFEAGKSFSEALAEVKKELELITEHKTYARDVPLRYPHLHRDQSISREVPNIVIERVDRIDSHAPVPGSQLTLLVGESVECCWVYDARLFSLDSVKLMQRGFLELLQAAAADLDRPITRLPLMTEQENSRVTVEWNNTYQDYPKHQCVHQLVEAQVEATPDKVALIFEDQTLTYRELNVRANRLAHYLGKLGVGPEVPVGIHVERSLEMVVGLLGILKAGGAYVPLDPTYPKERLAFMLEDCEAPVLLTQERLMEGLPGYGGVVVRLDSEWADIERVSEGREGDENPGGGARPENLAYIIYTSGSTGKPKGVMVEHRNVVSFFTGMDERVGRESPGVWLAVTSISFDISVLELIWTLARGFKVVIYSDASERAPLREGHHQTAAASQHNSPTGIDFSLFYFASDGGESAQDKYRLLLEGAKYADKHGFAAVWTPERHFHAFGGLYPNPSVVSAALAAVTRRVSIRAGSVVLPLHSPIRVAEEWSVVDNLSGGRAAISFASGWQPNDFVLRPENFAESKQVMLRDIDVVRRLWRGEAVSFPGPLGKDVEVRILPRPMQEELPFWVTAAGNPETFQTAGAIGANMLTHLLGQSVDDLAEKIALYREARRENGHNPDDGRVTLMLHTFVWHDEGTIRDKVRGPLTEYLRSSVGLLKGYAGTFPAFKSRLNGADAGSVDFGTLSDADMDALLGYSFERYYETSGLFGTPESCSQMVDRLKEIGVNEIACLIDFGVETDTVLASLRYLSALRARYCEQDEAPELDETEDSADYYPNYTLPAQVSRHQVTHLQCTPSMARMLVMGGEGREALGSLRRLHVGGEALPPSLARELQSLTSADITNMYGPTETAIWSSTYRLNGASDSVPIGRPIANTRFYIVDSHLQPVPPGVTGELLIGGAGVVRGYLHRDDLTGERFIEDLFGAEPNARLYRTGDLARYRADGNVEFLGRGDQQVKLRGYRIELGEIESLLAEHPAVSETAVVVREDIHGEKHLVSYVVPESTQGAVDLAEVRRFLSPQLPEYMLPSMVVLLDALPLTPNGKLDRLGLPAPSTASVEKGGSFVAPRTMGEKLIADIWADVLSLERIGIHDNFFDLGGHSLLAVQVISRLRDAFRVQLPLHTLFQSPTIAGLAAAIETTEEKAPQKEVPAIMRASRDAHRLVRSS
jgi:natural product biosynthesis luciferase-like monooxygenase protein